MATSPSKTTIVWRDDRFRDLEDDIRRFKARAVGARLKELAMLGLLAERVGFRIEMTAKGAELAGGHTIILNPPPGSPALSPVVVPDDPPIAVDEPDEREFNFASQFST